MLNFFEKKQIGEYKENRILEKEIIKLANNPQESRECLYRSLLDSMLIVATRPISGVSEKQLREKTDLEGLKIGCYTTFYNKAKQGLPVFTKEEFLKKWRSEQFFIYLRGRDLFEMASEMSIDAVIINYLAPIGGFIYPWEIKELAQGKIPIEMNRKININQGTKIFYRKPTNPPPESLITGFQNILYKSQGILSGFIFEICIEGSNELPHLALGLVLNTTPDKAIEPIFYQFDSVIRSCLKENEYIDIMPLNDENLIKYLEYNVGVFFQKQ